MHLKEELALVAKAQSHDQAALGMLWDAITPKLYGYLVNVMRQKHLADDVLQDTWLKAITSLSSFRPRGVRFSAWLFAIARNECRQRWRKDGREVALPEDENALPSETSSKAMTEKMLVDSILKKLPEDDGEILRLRYIGELSFKEIARVLGISMTAARVRVHRALLKARAGLDKT